MGCSSSPGRPAIEPTRVPDRCPPASGGDTLKLAVISRSPLKARPDDLRPRPVYLPDPRRLLPRLLGVVWCRNLWGSVRITGRIEDT